MDVGPVRSLRCLRLNLRMGLAQNSFLFRMYKQMPSVGTVIAQRKTNKLVVTQDYGNGGDPGEWGPYWFPQGNVASWYANNSDDITKVTDSVYIVKDGSDFGDVIDNLESQGHINGRRTFTDLGKTLYIGNSTNANLVVLQLVEVYGLAADGGQSGAVGYIVVENNTSDVGTEDSGRFIVRVARV